MLALDPSWELSLLGWVLSGVFYRIRAPPLGPTAQLGPSLCSQVFPCHVPFPALLFSPCWDSLVGGVLKYYICLLYLNCLALLTCFKPGNIDIEQCVCRGIILWKIALPVMLCWMSLAMVITNFQTSLNGSPESQVVSGFMPQT